MYDRALELNGHGESWNLSQVLLADDIALVTNTKVKLHHLATELGRVCEWRKL